MRTGRPRKETGSKKRKLLRKWWRKASAKYYNENRDKILYKAHLKVPDIVQEPLVRYWTQETS